MKEDSKLSSVSIVSASYEGLEKVEELPGLFVISIDADNHLTHHDEVVWNKLNELVKVVNILVELKNKEIRK